MRNRSEEIKQLLNKKINAADMTKALKEIGDGDMQKGLNILAGYFNNNGIKIGEKRGFAACLVVALGGCTVAGFIYLLNKCKMNKKVKVDGEKIYEALKETIIEEE